MFHLGTKNESYFKECWTCLVVETMNAYLLMLLPQDGLERSVVARGLGALRHSPARRRLIFVSRVGRSDIFLSCIYDDEAFLHSKPLFNC